MRNTILHLLGLSCILTLALTYDCLGLGEQGCDDLSHPCCGDSICRDGVCISSPDIPVKVPKELQEKVSLAEPPKKNFIPDAVVKLASAQDKNGCEQCYPYGICCREYPQVTCCYNGASCCGYYYCCAPGTFCCGGTQICCPYKEPKGFLQSFSQSQAYTHE